MSEFDFDGETERRRLEELITDDVIRGRLQVVEATEGLGPALDRLRASMPLPKDPATDPQLLPVGGPIVSSVDMPTPLSAGFGVVHGANLGPLTQVRIRSDGEEHPTTSVLVGPGRLEFRIPPEINDDGCVLVVDRPAAAAPEVHLHPCRDEEHYDLGEESDVDESEGQAEEEE